MTPFTRSIEVKEIVENLKNSFGSKDKYVLTKDDKDKLLNYIEQVNDTNNDYKNMKRLSNTLNNVDKERYIAFTIDLYEHGAIDRETFVDVKDNYPKDKRKDNFER